MDDEKQQSEQKPKNENRGLIRPGAHFSSDNQPTGEQKSAGWWKKRKGRALLRHLLELDFDGTMVDEKTGEKQENKLKKQVAAYMNVPVDAVTVEMVIFVKQIALAIQKNDSYAATLVLDNAYGKPKELVQLYDDQKPVVMFKAADGSDLTPVILEEENLNTSAEDIPKEEQSQDKENSEIK